MAGPDDDSDKNHEPTQKKLDDARKRGEVPMSQDLTTTGAYAGLVICAGTLGASLLTGVGEDLAGLLAQADTLSARVFRNSPEAPIGAFLGAVLKSSVPWLLFPVLGVLIAVVAQQAFTMSAKKIQPKLSRISPLENAKQKFGRNGLFNFTKSFVKLTIFSAILGYAIYRDLPTILSSAATSVAGHIHLLMALGFDFLAVVLVVSFGFGFIDFLWQRAEHIRKNRMSHKELQDETKDSEGDPHLKQRRRQKAYDIATNQMISDVPQADVVIVNPTHYAVALKWDRGSGRAPICIAKGVDEVAGRIREAAAAHAVPLRRDPPTARALFATLDIGDEVLPEHYRPVAAAIRFAEAVRKRARRSLVRRS
ncbi:MAG: flagellar type III secretion system protein FlhB [Pseudomonadota bacterium]